MYRRQGVVKNLRIWELVLSAEYGFLQLSHCSVNCCLIRSRARSRDEHDPFNDTHGPCVRITSRRGCGKDPPTHIHFVIQHFGRHCHASWGSRETYTRQPSRLTTKGFLNQRKSLGPKAMEIILGRCWVQWQALLLVGDCSHLDWAENPKATGVVNR